MSAERDERLLLDACAASEHLRHRAGEVVVRDALRHAAEGVECRYVPGQKALLLRRRKGTHEGLERVRQAHAKQLRGLLHSGDAHQRLSPVALRLRSWRVTERDESGGVARVRPFPLMDVLVMDVLADPALAACEPVLGD